MALSALPTYTAGSMRGVPYNELDDSMKFEITGNTATGVRRFRVAWADRFDFLRAVLGEHTWLNGELQLFTGAQSFPGYDVLFANNCGIEGEGRISNDGGEVEFTSAIITVKYMPRSYEDEEQDEEERVLQTEEMDFAGEFLTVPEGHLRWGGYFLSRYGKEGNPLPDANKPIQQQSQILIPTIDYVYTKKNVEKLPKTAIKNLLGKVNSGLFPPPGPNRKSNGPGTVLFVGGSARRQYTSEGARPYEVTLVFKYREPAWNYLWHAVPAGGDATKPWATTQPPLYESGDFEPLYKFIDGES